jgi:putative ABC transport system permease protein
MSPLDHARRPAPATDPPVPDPSQGKPGSFFLIYLRHELIRRRRQTAAIVLGLAVGIGLVITVTAASAGISRAQADVLHTLYGIGTDITVTKVPPRPPAGSAGNGPAEQKNDSLGLRQGLAALDHSGVSKLGRLPGVAAAGGGLTLTDTQTDAPPGGFAPPGTFAVDGVDVTNAGLGPYASAPLQSGRSFTGADAGAEVAVVNSTYAATQGLSVGSVVVVAGRNVPVVGVVSQARDTGAPDVYLPLLEAQRLSHLTGQVDTIYVRATSSTDLGAVQHAISALMPGATVTSSANLADAVSGSLASAAKLAGQLGRWLSAATLVAAFAVASLLTIAAVDRRIREFGTLKALGWRGRRIVGQVMGESLVTGTAGAVLGVLLGLGGSLLVRLAAPSLSATVPQSPGATGTTASQPQIITVHLTAPVTLTTVLLAALLAVAGGVVAGVLGGWRAVRLRPSEAIRRVG